MRTGNIRSYMNWEQEILDLLSVSKTVFDFLGPWYLNV